MRVTTNTVMITIIFQEIIQNAEDAGASCVRFIYDKNDYREHLSKIYTSDGLKQYQVFISISNFLFFFLSLLIFFVQVKQIKMYMQ